MSNIPHRVGETFVTPENIKTLLLFIGMFLGSYGIGNQTTGNISSSVHKIGSKVSSLSHETKRLSEEIEGLRAALADLKHGTVNPSNISRIVALTSIISELDRDNSKLWTSSGYPKISVLETELKNSGRMDYKVSATERDHACILSNMCRPR